MTNEPARLEGGLFDVRDILGDEKKTWEFSLALWCALTGLPVEEALRREIEADKRKARYGPPLEAPEWTGLPKEADCDACGKRCQPFGTSLEYRTDVPSHRWVRIWRCMACDDEHQLKKWAAIGHGLRHRREGSAEN
jgi:hypothetical protein